MRLANQIGLLSGIAFGLTLDCLYVHNSARLRVYWNFSDPTEEQSICENQVEIELLDCYASCNNDQDCTRDCTRNYDKSLENCPCHSGCPNGCPCPNYTCSTVINSSVLILNTYEYSDARSTPIITDFDGNVSKRSKFQIEDDVEVFNSCGLTFKGEFYVFGGGVDDFKRSGHPTWVALPLFFILWPKPQTTNRKSRKLFPETNRHSRIRFLLWCLYKHERPSLSVFWWWWGRLPNLSHWNWSTRNIWNYL